MDAQLHAAITAFIKTHQTKYTDGKKFIGCFKAKIENNKVIITQVELINEKS
jgi:hypothetical protein